MSQKTPYNGLTPRQPGKQMDRKPSTKIKAPRYRQACPRQPMNRELWRDLFEEARRLHGKPLEGLTSVDEGRAWFQIAGDATPYSVLLSEDELKMFHL
ncbi:hypothetical protein P9A54_gp20 [Xanthomonas phage vB_Xar_IVIA-DoCa10]|uniref:Uncharacterized protein n=3 Tax=Bosavirus TaxID=2946834 RepID=A0A9X9JQ85_9CAUD|nr:hypothetical protein P9A54_gp20 [Xanthomonas phage vB_Xar_IVIA-DoCa10]UYA99005.1 hypothetical protein IVIADoCa10_20 [Xanthomonas phage vB_Xar_IVIA-DoCa10]